MRFSRLLPEHSLPALRAHMDSYMWACVREKESVGVWVCMRACAWSCSCPGAVVLSVSAGGVAPKLTTCARLLVGVRRGVHDPV